MRVWFVFSLFFSVLVAIFAVLNSNLSPVSLLACFEGYKTSLITVLLAL